MEKTRVSTIPELSVDVVDYLFVEWLCRRGVFSAYRSNCGFGQRNKKTFRTVRRQRIQDVLQSFDSGIGDLISLSFIYTDAPEGYAFWAELSFAWRRFCANFQTNFK